MVSVDFSLPMKGSLVSLTVLSAPVEPQVVQTPPEVPSVPVST